MTNEAKYKPQAIGRQ